LAKARKLARQYIEGFHAADLSRISVHALADGGSPGDDQRERRIGRVLDGYDRVIDWLAEPLGDRVRPSAIATRVHWDPGRVSVEARHPDGRARPSVEARAAIIAVPLAVLQAPGGDEGTIEFDPELRAKRPALERLTTGSVVRIAFALTERFWSSGRFTRRRGIKDGELDDLSFLQTSDAQFPTWWTAYPVRAPVLVGWNGGPGARAVSQLASEQIEDVAISALARQLGFSRRTMRGMVTGSWMHDWEHDPFARGAYSYQTVGGRDAPAMLARPLHGTLFFAGEAANRDGRTGTVHGAIATGRRAAAEVSRSFKSASGKASRRTAARGGSD
jgi:monoamine oxidase